MRLWKSLPLVLLAGLLLGACSSLETTDEEAQEGGASVESRDGESAATQGIGEGGDAQTQGVGGQGAWTGSPLDDPTSPLASRTIYFDFDSSDIRSDYVEVLRAHAQYLAANAAVTVTLEGHADERGTREYNLALGEQRARRVKQFMMAEGVADAQLNDLSYGEERPVDPGQGEGAWAQNRRVEIVY